MEITAAKQPRSRSEFTRPFLAATISLALLHVAVLLFLPHPVVASNIIQLCFPLLVFAVSLHQRSCTTNSIGNRCWSGLASAFAIWSLAQGLFLYYLKFPPKAHWLVRPDDALWVLFGLPLLMAVTATTHDVDRVAWLDRAQATLFFSVLYLLVFLPSGGLPVHQAYIVQNLALVLCCLLRLPICTLARERRFFFRLAVFLVAYSSLEEFGEAMYARGWQVGSLVDLVWTLPITLLLLLILHDARSTEPELGPTTRLVRAVGSMQGLSVAAMTFLSVGLSALLATRKPFLGGVCVASAFTLFALRTNARERLWHQAHKRLEQTVLQDALTGLGNRLQLRNALQAWLQEPNDDRVALLFVDLDRFKQINDSLGHALGDQLLIEVGKRLRIASPPESIVCRLGGDEFVVLTRAHDQRRAEGVGETLLRALHMPFHVDTHSLCITASIGVVGAVPGETADCLLRTADHAMYRAKQLGKNRVQFFDAALREQMSSRWQMEAGLRACLEAGEIGVAFQPIYAVEEGRICGFEALARWSHPVLGNVSPAEFIPLAEDSGLILALGAQVLEKACAQLVAWNRTWNTALSVSVNVSPRQFADASLLPSLLEILDRTELAPSLLRLEITETALLTNQDIVKSTLEQARAHGIRISLDDFGTGYSSLSFLLSLPVDEVKVDRSFVSNMHRDPDREELVRTVIHLGHSLGKRVVAEGVESEQDLVDLTSMGCECVQGFLISKPLPAEAMEDGFRAIAGRGMKTPLTGLQNGSGGSPGGRAFAEQSFTETPASISVPC